MKKTILFLLISTLAFSQIVEKNTREFTKIDIALDAVTKISFGDEHSFEIKGDERDLERIQYGIRGDKLYIEMEDSRGWNWFKKRQRDEVEVRIVIKRLEDLDISGTGEAMVAEMDQVDLKVDVSGTVDFETSGRIDYLNFGKCC